MYNNLTFDDVFLAHQRIKDFVENTPVISDEKLNKVLDCEVFFKLENKQKTKSFKARGAFNAILAYKEKHGKFPEKIVAQSSGNHAQAVANAAKIFGIPAIIYMAANTSPFKVAATRALGAEVVLCEKRKEANRLAEEKQNEGYFFIHPSDHDDVIAGQGTATFEALEKIGEVDAIFAPCGGGGLVSGCFLAAQKLSPKAKTFACEPLNANDAAISVREGQIFQYEDSPNTVADGARTLAVSQRCFNYLKKLNGIIEVTEGEILSAQNQFQEIFQMKIEPTSALAFAGLKKYLEVHQAKKALVIISGGNL